LLPGIIIEALFGAWAAEVTRSSYYWVTPVIRAILMLLTGPTCASHAFGFTITAKECFVAEFLLIFAAVLSNLKCTTALTRIREILLIHSLKLAFLADFFLHVAIFDIFENAF